MKLCPRKFQPDRCCRCQSLAKVRGEKLLTFFFFLARRVEEEALDIAEAIYQERLDAYFGDRRLFVRKSDYSLGDFIYRAFWLENGGVFDS